MMTKQNDLIDVMLTIPNGFELAFKREGANVNIALRATVHGASLAVTARTTMAVILAKPGFVAEALDEMEKTLERRVRNVAAEWSKNEREGRS